MFLTAMGIACPLGQGKAAVAAALRQGDRHGLVARSDLLAERSVSVGAVPGPLPHCPLPDYDCRNNRLLQATLEEIAADIKAAIRRYGRSRIAVIMGTSTSGNDEALQAIAERDRSGHWPPGYRYSRQDLGGPALFVAQLLDLDGPAYTISTACTSSAKAFAAGRRLIRAGLADAAIVGGADSLCALTLTGFDALAALSPGLCNPSSANRDGITIGEGAAVFLLEAEGRGVALLGSGESSDAHHVSAPHPEGLGAIDAMRQALAEAQLTPGDITYVNLHGTATPLNDAMEHAAVAQVFGNAVAASSTKAMTGHMLGAAGACEAALVWLTLSPEWNPQALLPPHLWDGVVDPALAPLDLVARGTQFPRRAGTAMLSNSFAFGGSNASLLLGWRN